MGTTQLWIKFLTIAGHMKINRFAGTCGRKVIAQDVGESVDVHRLQRERLLTRFQLLKVEKLIHQAVGVVAHFWSRQ